MLKIKEIPLDFIINNIPDKTKQVIEVKYELVQRCKGRNNISQVCNELSNELSANNLNYTEDTLRHIFYCYTHT